MPGLEATSPAGAVPHVGICPQCQRHCWHHHRPTAVIVRRVSPELQCTLEFLKHSPQRAEQSLRQALVAQFANPSGTMWEEICFLNVSHYQLMGMLANGERSETRGWPSTGQREGCAATGTRQDVGTCHRQPQDVIPPIASNGELWFSRLGTNSR